MNRRVPEHLSILYSPEEIDRCVSRMAKEIDRDFLGSRLVVVGVLKGAFLFMADLVRKLHIETELDFLQLSSYGSQRASSGSIELKKSLDLAIRDRDVLVVEDIVDTGLSLKFLREHLGTQRPSRLAFAGLVDKVGARIVEASLDYVGFETNAGFLVGYGMDDGERYRDLPGLYRVLPEGDS